MSGAPDQAPKKPILPPSRIAVIVFAIVAAVIVMLELRARGQWDRTYKAISAQMDEEAGKEGIVKKDLDKYVQGSPKREGGKETELFTWSGVLQKYRMRLHYSGDMIVRIEQE